MEEFEHMKSKLVIALVILGAVLSSMGPLAAQTPPPTSLAGSWQFTLIPGNPTGPTIHALATFTSDGSVIETDSSEVVSTSQTARSGFRAATPGHGIWQPAPAFGNLFIQFISLVVNQNESLYARKTVTIGGALDSTGNNFSGSYAYALVDPNGGMLATGSGTVAGQRIPHPLLP
jgi:hypothetical protein